MRLPNPVVGSGRRRREGSEEGSQTEEGEGRVEVGRRRYTRGVDRLLVGLSNCYGRREGGVGNGGGWGWAPQRNTETEDTRRKGGGPRRRSYLVRPSERFLNREERGRGLGCVLVTDGPVSFRGEERKGMSFGEWLSSTPDGHPSWGGTGPFTGSV